MRGLLNCYLTSKTRYWQSWQRTQILGRSLKMIHLSIFLTNLRRHLMKSLRGWKNRKSLRKRSISPERHSDLLLTVHLCYSSVLLTLLSLTLCTNTHYSGLPTCLGQVLTGLPRHLMMPSKESRTWMTTSLSTCMRMCADLCLRNISWCCHSYSLSRY